MRTRAIFCGNTFCPRGMWRRSFLLFSIRLSLGLWWSSTGSSSPKRRRVTWPKNADCASSRMKWDLQPATAYFTEGEATAYPIHIPADFELSDAQNAKFDAYLAKRFQGDFTMAGIKFWADMKGLDEAFLKRRRGSNRSCPSLRMSSLIQANRTLTRFLKICLTGSIWCWRSARESRDTLFVIRAHPDETRVRKSSRETVEGWATSREVEKEANIVFVSPLEALSSYELIQRSKFVMIYNSTIGWKRPSWGCGGVVRGQGAFYAIPHGVLPANGG
jgi:hypothetical protein